MKSEFGPLAGVLLPVLLAGCLSQAEPASVNPTASLTPVPETPWAESKTDLPHLTPSVTPTATQEVTETPSHPRTTIVAVGDVMLGRMVNIRMTQKNDRKWPFLNVAQVMREADIATINLEGPFYDPCALDGVSKIFCSPTSSVEGLVFAGVDVATTANNHIGDKTAEGYASTITTLEANQILPSDQDHLAVLNREGVRFGFLSFNLVKPIFPDWNPEEIPQEIALARSQVDVLVVSFHWGDEYHTEHNDKQEEMAHQAIDSGADLVIGHHPHVPQEVEEYKGKLIIYSLGNFIFDQMWSEATKRGVMVTFQFEDKKLIFYEFTPVVIEDYGQPRFIDE